jgi:acetyl esterase/lipase
MDVLSRVPPAADHRIPYGAGALQFGDLRLPKLTAGKLAPVVMFVHGGWWKAAYDLTYGGHLCEALRGQGIATWSIEYRRVGDAGGGWPGTFEDVAAGYEFLRELGTRYPLDLGRVVVAGHSAGGHLAFWLAGRHHVPAESPIARPAASLRMHGVVALAGAVGLQMTIDLSGWFTFAHDKQEIANFLGGLPADVPERYKAGDPAELLPFNVAQVLVQGTEDDQIPPQLPRRWAERAGRVGDTVRVEIVPGADHLDVVDPESKAWPRVLAALETALG